MFNKKNIKKSRVDYVNYRRLKNVNKYNVYQIEEQGEIICININNIYKNDFEEIKEIFFDAIKKINDIYYIKFYRNTVKYDDFFFTIVSNISFHNRETNIRAEHKKLIGRNFKKIDNNYNELERFLLETIEMCVITMEKYDLEQIDKLQFKII